MTLKIFSILLICLSALTACNNSSTETAQKPSEGKGVEAKSNQANSSSGENVNTGKTEAENKSLVSQSKEPRNVREFFALLPDEYFTLEGCDRATDKNCDRARAEYLKTFLEVEDTANGYMKGGCDGGQSCFTMALFKRPDGRYLVGLSRSFEMGDDYFFLEYEGGRWRDVSAEVIPEFSKKNMYELPRKGTTIQVFAKEVIDEGDNYGDKYEITEKGARLYALEWKDGKFTKKK
jgi:hypothetical protein